MSSHPDAHVLERLMDGQLRPDEAAPLREHVRSCRQCQDVLRGVADDRQARAQAEAAAQAGAAGAQEEPPEDVIDVRQQLGARAATELETPAAALKGQFPAPTYEEAEPTMAPDSAVLSLDPDATVPPLLAKRIHAQARRLGEDEPADGLLPDEGDTREQPAAQPRVGGAAAEAQAPEQTQALPKGEHVGRYVILEQLGVGGMGVVYAAFDPELNRKVALKLLRTSQKRTSTHPSEGRSRLLREAQAMARISHPNIVAVYDVGSIGDEVYVAMELVEGTTLTGWLKTKRSWREVVQMFRFAGRGLSAAHAAGLVHRDFKPDNVLVANDGRVRVTDFGLARPTVGEVVDPTLPPVAGAAAAPGTPDYLLSPLTRAGTIVGTPVYMAPEQFLGEPVDARTDQYAFCVALYEALYGQLPYNAKTVRGLAKLALAGRLPKLPLDPRVPISLHRIVLKGLRPKREDRWPSMAALLGALELATWVRRRASWAALAAAVVAGVVLWLRPWGPAADEACRNPERQLAGVWDEGVRQQVREVFLKVGGPQADAAFGAVARDLDRYMESWSSARTQACEATFVRAEQTRDVLELRLSCLDRRRRELAAFVQLLSVADAATLTRSVQSSSSLPDLSACADIAALVRRSRLPAKESERGRVEELRGQLAQAEAHRAQGQYQEAVKLCTQVAAAARELRFRPLEADAFLLLGRLLDRSGDFPAAEQALLEAVWAAESAQLLDVEAEAMTELVSVVGQRQSRHAEGHRWGRHAASVLEALSDPPKLAADLVDHLGTLSRAEGDYDKSLQNHQRALSLREKTFGADSPNLASSLQSLGTTYTALGRKEEALACYERAQRLMEAAYGGGHPRVSSLRISLGIALSALGRNDEALKVIDAGLEADERVFGAQSAGIAPGLNARATVLMRLGRLEEALPVAERALRLMEQSLGKEHPRLATYRLTAGEIHLRKGDPAAALAYAEQAHAIRERALGPSHFDVGQTLYHVSEAHLQLGRPAEAKVLLERALALRERSKAYPAMLASIRYALARSLVETGGDKDRARALAQLAEQTFMAEGTETRVELAEVRAWLARNGGAVVRLDPP